MTRVTCQPDWAARIREVLQAQGRHQSWLADQLEISESYLSRILNGSAGYYLESPMMLAIAKALGVPQDWLYTDDGPTVNLDLASDHEDLEPF